MYFTIFQNAKTPFQAIETKRSKSGKSAIFPKGLVHGFGQKLAIFPNFFLKAIQHRKMSLTIFQNEKTLFQAIKTRSSKSGKIAILPKGLAHGFGQKLAIFPSFFFQAVQARKMSLTIFQNEKTRFLGYKKKSLKSGKIAIDPNGLVHGFGKKLAIFPSFFFWQHRPGKCVLPYSRTKKSVPKL